MWEPTLQISGKQPIVIRHAGIYHSGLHIAVDFIRAASGAGPVCAMLLAYLEDLRYQCHALLAAGLNVGVDEEVSAAASTIPGCGADAGAYLGVSVLILACLYLQGVRVCSDRHGLMELLCLHE